MKYKINNYNIEAESPTEAVKIYKLIDSKANDDNYSFKELMSMLVGKHPNKNGYQTDIFKVNGKYSLNPNVHRERFNTIEEAKKYIETRGNDSCNDESIEEKIHKAQEWVDFDIKHHGEVSELTKKDIEKMGLKYDKWNNQVTDSDIEELSDEEKQAIEDYKKAISNTNDPKLLKIFGHILKEEVEHLEELQNEELIDSCKDEKLSPMTYKKLRELGYNENQWKNWTQEQANNIIASKKKTGSNEKQEKQSKLTPEQKEMQNDLTEELKEYFSDDHKFKVKKMGWVRNKAVIDADDPDKAFKEIERDYAYNDVVKSGNKVIIEFDLD